LETSYSGNILGGASSYTPVLRLAQPSNGRFVPGQPPGERDLQISVEPKEMGAASPGGQVQPGATWLWPATMRVGYILLYKKWGSFFPNQISAAFVTVMVCPHWSSCRVGCPLRREEGPQSAVSATGYVPIGTPRWPHPPISDP
jgi:hypothetical protein